MVVKLSMSNILNLTKVTIAFPCVVNPYVSPQVKEKGGPGSFTCDFIFPPGDPTYAKFHSIYKEMAIAKWGARAEQLMEQIHGDRKARCYGDGKQKFKKDTGAIFDGYEGNFFLSASNKDRPSIVDANGDVIDPANTMAVKMMAAKFYGGCKVNAIVSVWLQNHTTAGVGVRLNLLGMQFESEGPRFGGGTPDVSGMFGKVAATEPAATGQIPAAQYPWEK
jgi:Protein of unknown function (DUF2815)